MDQIPEHVRAFLTACIDSVEQLEVLALLHDHPTRPWTAISLSQELRSTETSVARRLETLVSRKVIEPISVSAAADRAESPTFTYTPVSPAVAATVAEVVNIYRLRPYRVMDLIFSKPVSAMQSFADAFRFKKDES